ncbi:hypothetical protein [Hymenobacter sp. B1770]|uniref:hypothetical protein n=1 Tax=Hymenobacter sp. B1770 TaxID=1718788 RepID=UPI003CEC2779
MGYDFKPVLNNRVRFGVKGLVLNVLNEFYFTDVSTRASSNTGSLDNLQAFFNRGRTFTVGLSATACHKRASGSAEFSWLIRYQKTEVCEGFGFFISS